MIRMRACLYTLLSKNALPVLYGQDKGLHMKSIVLHETKHNVMPLLNVIDVGQTIWGVSSMQSLVEEVMFRSHPLGDGVQTGRAQEWLS